MTLQLAPLEEGDIPAYAQLELDAFRPHPRTPMVWTKGENDSVHAYIEDGKRKGLKDPKEHSIKCIDTASGRVVAGATYTFAFEVKHGEAVAVEPAEVIAEDAPPPSNWPDGGNWRITRFYKINTPKVIQHYLGGKPYILLDNLTVLPEYQGRRIGQRLLLWGAEQADQLKIRMCLESTPAGRRLYESFGFREVTSIKADMNALGWSEPYDDEAAARIFMMREPGAARPQVDWREQFSTATSSSSRP